MEQLTSEQVLQYADTAFEQQQFVAFFQPQYNMTTGMLVGAEALARWIHPEFGIIPPFQFIPVLEENGLISKLDLSIFESTCKFLRYCLDEQVHTVPISVNLSREDIYCDGFIETMDDIRNRYELPVNLIRLEVVESIASEGRGKAQAIIDKLHGLGYLVELDDFGSGYSSLNVLKDVDYDIMKLDMEFMSDDLSGRGGTIVSSVVRMAKWLKMPVIAEGVETQKQADFMKSIGCEYVQGYLYSRPIPQDEYLALLQSKAIGLTTPALDLKETVNPVSFWNPQSIETLVFNNYVGGAAVLRYGVDSSIEFLRVNHKYITEMGMNMTETDVINSNLWDTMSEDAQKTYRAMLEKAIQTEEEQECETWRKVCSSCCGDDDLCVRSNVILIGKSEYEYIFYASIRNITAEKKRYSESLGFEQKFINITEQANIYYWEYTVATKEMRPCFRCMRDLGLPPLVTNYPEPAIEQGIFPPDYADMYRDWHKQIASGVEHLEAVIPLTVGRVPFHVRYTTEFDELGRPVKAFGSATLVTPEEQGK